MGRIVRDEDREPPNRLAVAGPASVAAVEQVWFPALRFEERGAGGTDACLPDSESSARFRRRHYPGVGAERWSDWRWQFHHRVCSAEELSRLVPLARREQDAFGLAGPALPFAVTPYYAGLLTRRVGGRALRRSVVPSTAELVRVYGESSDPLGEEGQSPVPGLVHRYPDRVLLLATGSCAAYCRYCTRSRSVGEGSEMAASRRRWQAALDYIAATPQIRDVLVSGGDPLTLPDEAIGWLLEGLRRIRHIEVIRIGTKTPAVLPQRITGALVALLRRYHPLWMSLHFTHPAELTTEAIAACARLADAGIPLGSQTVLLAGINDDVETMRGLLHGLQRARVRPYYLYQCDPISGSSHFRTSVDDGLALLSELRGHTSGYAVPTYVIDAPGGGGKVPIAPSGIVGREGGDLLVRNHEGALFRYPDLPRAGAEKPKPASSGEAS